MVDPLSWLFSGFSALSRITSSPGVFLGEDPGVMVPTSTLAVAPLEVAYERSVRLRGAAMVADGARLLCGTDGPGYQPVLSGH